MPAPEFFAHQLPFNVIPQIDKFQENGYTKEEMKVTWELQKIFGLEDDVKVACTAVRVPTLRAHSESITVETEEPIAPEEVRELLKSAPGAGLKGLKKLAMAQHSRASMSVARYFSVSFHIFSLFSFVSTCFQKRWLNSWVGEV